MPRPIWILSQLDLLVECGSGLCNDTALYLTQWNHSIADTIGPQKRRPLQRGVHYKEVHTSQGFHYLTHKTKSIMMLLIVFQLLKDQS